MRNGMKAGLAIGVGYLLGRRRKMRLAAMLAAGAATGGFGGAAGRMLKSGGKKLAESGSLGQLSPELGKVTDALKGELVGAGKAAASAAISNRIESLTGSLHDRTQSLLQADEPDDAGEVEEREEPGEADGPEEDENGQDAGQAAAERRGERRPQGRRSGEDGGSGRKRPARPADRDGRGYRDRPGDRDRRSDRRGSPPVRRRPASSRQTGGE